MLLEAMLNLTNGTIIWILIIVFIKIVNAIVNTNSIIFESIICSITAFAAVQEGHYIRTRSYNISSKKETYYTLNYNNKKCN